MDNITTQNNLAIRITRWMEDERNGNPFPICLDEGWKIAGYSRKDAAKRKLPKSAQGELFHSSVEKSGGRPKEVIQLSCDGLKHLCLMAETEEGRLIRQYFIEAEKKWRMVQEQRPNVAGEIEMMKLKIELAAIESQKESAIARSKNADLQLTQFRHYVTTALPEPVQQKILGYEEVKTTEIVERVIDRSSGEMSDGLGITYVAKSLGLTNKQCWSWLERNGYGKNSEHWEPQLSAVTSLKMSRETFEEVKHRFGDGGDRQMWIGE